MIDDALKELEEKKLDTLKRLDAVLAVNAVAVEAELIIKSLEPYGPKISKGIKTIMDEDFAEILIKVSDSKALLVHIEDPGVNGRCWYECISSLTPTITVHTYSIDAVLEELNKLINEPTC